MTTDKKQNKRPDFIAYHVKNINDGSRWTQLGAAWKHADGKGINLVLDSVPLDGLLTLREPKSEEQDQVQPS